MTVVTFEQNSIEFAGHATQSVVCHGVAAIGNMVANYLEDNQSGKVARDNGYMLIYDIKDDVLVDNPFLNDGQKMVYCSTVKKSIETNKFWMHNVKIKKNSELLSPATTQVLNETQSSSKETITDNEKKSSTSLKLSISVDATWFELMDEEIEENNASIIEEGFDALKLVSIDEKVMRKVANRIKKDYATHYPMNDLVDNLTRIFAYIKNTDNVNYQDMVRIMREVAKPVIEQSTEVDAWQQSLYDDFRSCFKGKTIRLSEEQQKEVAYHS